MVESRPTGRLTKHAKVRGLGVASPRVRFDKVALRLVRSVRHPLEAAVPDGTGVLFAVTAPIREPAKTMAALVETIGGLLSLGPGEFAATLYGNDVRVRVVRRRLPRAARIVGFVHNREPPPDAVLDMAEALLVSTELPELAEIGGAALDARMARQIMAEVLNADS